MLNYLGKVCLFLSFIYGLPAWAQASLPTDKVFLSKDHKFKVETLTKQSDVIWGFDFVSNDEVLFSERGGVLKLLNLKTKTVAVVEGGPAVWARGQGGLLDVAVNPKNSRQVFLSYSVPVEKKMASTAIGVGTLNGQKLEGFKKIFEAFEANSNTIHFGSRIVFDEAGHLLFTVGDRDERERAQDLSYHNGKVLRIKTDGIAPEDNPFTKTKGARPEIWSLGHRNPQGLAIDATTGRVWEAEFGPRGGDELNLIKPGENYGWPKVTFGKEYWGPSIGVKELKGYISPVAHWVPSISPSGLMFYNKNLFAKWQGNLFLANLSERHIRRLKIENEKVVEQETLLSDLEIRFRQVKVGPSGEIYFSTDNGEIGRIVPAIK
jgi:glucose/arabinose dehydrogenase